MQKTILTIILSILLIASIGLVGCGGSNTTSQPTQTTSQTSTQAQTTTAPITTQSPASTNQSPASGDIWSDMPIYPGSSQKEQFTGSVPPADNAEYSKFEWRYYETNDEISKVSSWCKDKMGSNGWQEQMWMATPEMGYGMFMKNGENDAAMLTIMSEEGKTIIALWRAKK